MNSSKKKLFFMVFMGIGILILFSREYLFASQVGTLRKYNLLTANWEKIEWSDKSELLHEGNVVYENFDFFTEHSFQKFLDDDHSLPNSYHPNDLVPIHSDFTTNDASHYQLRQKAAVKFAEMAWAFANAFDFKAKFSLTSAYRSPTFQKNLSSDCSSERCALP
jgi:hypothetical protein